MSEDNPFEFGIPEHLDELDDPLEEDDVSQSRLAQAEASTGDDDIPEEAAPSESYRQDESGASTSSIGGNDVLVIVHCNSIHHVPVVALNTYPTTFSP